MTAPRRGRPPSGADAAIVAAALSLVEEGGLAHLTTREVARRAGVSEASVFYHFGDKVGLLQAVMLAGLGPLENLDPTAFDRSERPLPTELLEIGKAFESFLQGALPVCEAVQADAALRRDFAARLEQRDLGPHRGVDLLAGVLAGLMESGRIEADVDANPAALLFFGACFVRAWVHHLADGALDDRLPSLKDTATTMARLLVADAGGEPAG